jgi:hypothetical protein
MSAPWEMNRKGSKNHEVDIYTSPFFLATEPIRKRRKEDD